jgi:hypothetical protein
MSKRTLCLSVVAVTLTLGLAAAPARAQVQEGQATFGNLIAALNNINVQIDNLEVLEDVEIGDITVVDASNLLQGARIRALNNALNRNNVEILNLRDVLNNNDVLNDALNDLNIAIGDVIAIDVLSGELTIFTL